MHGYPPPLPALASHPGLGRDLLTDDMANGRIAEADQTKQLLVMPESKGGARHQELKGIICQANGACMQHFVIACKF